MTSDAETPEAYIESLPPDRREPISALRLLILDALPDGYEEVMRWGMITYEVPLSICPDTYNGQPLMYVALASQKRHMAIYMMGLYSDPDLLERFVGRWRARGTRLDMGKSCLRFKRLEQVEQDLVSEVVGAYAVDAFVERVQRR